MGGPPTYVLISYLYLTLGGNCISTVVRLDGVRLASK